MPLMNPASNADAARRPPIASGQSQAPDHAGEPKTETHPTSRGHDRLTLAGVVAICLYLALLLPWGLVSLFLLALAVGEIVIRKMRGRDGEGSSDTSAHELGARTLESGRGQGHSQQQSSAASKYDGVPGEEDRVPTPSSPFVMLRAVIRGKVTLEQFVEGITGQNPADCLLPSLSEDQRNLRVRYQKEGEEKMRKIGDEIQGCEGLMKRVREQRQECLENTLSGQENLLDSSFGQSYTEYTRRSEDLAKHLETLKEDLRTVKSLMETQATFKKTGFHGLADWAKKLEDDHQDLMTAVVQVSFVGAGLTFTTIFSATRGDIGLMCYAWALFNCGFIIPTAAVALLEWASHRSPTTLFASPKIWSLLLTLFVYLSVFAAGAAIVLLNVTIILLHTDWSGPVQMQEPPVPAGAFALFCAAITAVMTLLAFVLHYAANGWGKLKDAWLGHPTDKDDGEKQDFDTYVLR